MFLGVLNWRKKQSSYQNKKEGESIVSYLNLSLLSNDFNIFYDLYEHENTKYLSN